MDAHGEGDGEVEGVVRRLVHDDEVVLLERELGQVDVVLGRSDQVDQLAELGLERRLEEELEQVDVVRLLAEVLLQQIVDRGLEHERVVDRNVADTGHAVPTRLATAGDRGVHEVVRDEEEALELGLLVLSKV